ncbi:uncharacterized protein LOC112084075 [Eutrema salsugineum]|uniref:uncharacterized protein LOC112084075 n=1 Tax=Eutrema salsugineum TaxID=72664 RepID=UPI000CED76CB|nr:uncharacterized protein LOC112084075 [Eutrema salsugineum]XP_024008406.1 uncharacterized protein LOC112084075 [Eutrema salsugineum]XP_024008407.1 uncharacterized protein LOC112084075 [Eutrema salsugineum]
MVEIYSVCGEWKINDKLQWEFIVDMDKGGSLTEVDENVTFAELVEMVIEDFGFGCSVKSEDIRLTYELPSKMKLMVELMVENPPPVNLRNDRQLRSFINKIKEDHELIRLCVTVSEKCNVVASENVGENIPSKTIHNEEDYVEENIPNTHVLQNFDGDSNVHEKQQELHRSSGSDMAVSIAHDNTCSTSQKGNCRVFYYHPIDPPMVSIGCSHSTGGTDNLHVNKHFKNKQELMFKMRKWALEWKFEFKSLWSNKSRVVLGCVNDKCTWRMRATKLDSSDVFVVKKYVDEHTCDTTHINADHRQATAKLLGALICSDYGSKKDGLKPKEIIERVRREHGVQIEYKKAWRVREQAQKLIRGTPDSANEILSAPPTTGQSSRRPSKRMRPVGELSSKFQRHKCSRCGEEGHNKNTCIVSI